MSTPLPRPAAIPSDFFLLITTPDIGIKCENEDAREQMVERGRVAETREAETIAPRRRK